MVNTNKKWDFEYDEEVFDEWGHNALGIITNGTTFGKIFYHICKMEETDDVESILLYGSLAELLDQSEMCIYPWTSRNDELLINALNEMSEEETTEDVVSRIKWIPYDKAID